MNFPISHLSYPFLPPLSAKNLKVYSATCFSVIAGIIFFGDLLAPTVSYSDISSNYPNFFLMPDVVNQLEELYTNLELKPGLGGTSYEDFIRSVHLPMQLRYLACARCSSTGSFVLIDPLATLDGGNQPLSPPRTESCSNCSGAGKVVSNLPMHRYGYGEQA